MGKMLWSTLDTVAFQPAKEQVFMQNFMNGRNGVDDLSAALGGIGVVLALLGTIFTWRIASYIALAILLVALFRAFSKNLAARERENDWFRSVMAKLPGGGSFARNRQTNTGARRGGTGSAAGTATADFKRQARTAKKMWKERKEKAFLKCPNCGTMLSVPRGKGKIIVTCPKCHARMETKS